LCTLLGVGSILTLLVNRLKFYVCEIQFKKSIGYAGTLIRVGPSRTTPPTSSSAPLAWMHMARA